MKQIKKRINILWTYIIAGIVAFTIFLYYFLSGRDDSMNLLKIIFIYIILSIIHFYCAYNEMQIMDDSIRKKRIIPFILLVDFSYITNEAFAVLDYP